MYPGFENIELIYKTTKHGEINKDEFYKKCENKKITISFA